MSDAGPPKARLLVVDDDDGARNALEKVLRAEGYAVDAASNGPEALAVASERAPDAVVSDLQMPGMDGIELIGALHAQDPDLPVLVVTAFGEVEAAVRAMRAGAETFLTKPVDIEALVVALDRALARRAARAEAESLREQLRAERGTALGGLIGASPAMQRVYQVARQVASARATVLITGESGTGKGQLARAIHARSNRSSAPFVQLHCAALAESLLESELFGHEKGSFTGADKRRIGRFEQAAGGTLFLDEVGEIPLSIQVKLLRVLQERKLERVGGNETIDVDARLIAATNRDLAEDVRAGRFREDLFYRLNVVHVEMPPLRLREGDVLALADHFLRRFARDNGKRIDGLTERAREKLQRHRWPGNVRELENAIERAVVLAEGNVLDADDLPFEASPKAGGGLSFPGMTMAELERYAILTTLESVGGSTTRAAEILDISVRTIQYRIHEYGYTNEKRR